MLVNAFTKLVNAITNTPKIAFSRMETRDPATTLGYGIATWAT